jgi:FKBP-type peptidyl-prolyl cis-trans isomerase (trigger factor)
MPKTKTEPKKKETKKAKSAPKNTQSNPIVDNKVFKLEFKWDEIKPVYDQTLTKLAKRLKKPGFRKGKVPANVAEQSINPAEVFDQVLQQIVPDKYIQYIKDNKLAPLTHPQIKPLKLVKGSDWELEVQIAEKPEIKLGKYQAEVKKGFKDAAKEIKERTAELKKKAAEAKKSKKKDDKAPAAPTELTEKEIIDVKLSNIFQALVRKIQPQIPELLVKERVRQEVEQLEHQLSHMQLKLEDYLKHQGQTFEQMTQRMAMMQLAQVQLEFVLEAIILAEKLEATPEEVKAKVEEMKKNLPKEQLAQFNEEAYTQHLTPVVNREKVTDFLLNLEK